MLKPMRPKDWDPKKVKFPVIGMPKVDGVRGLHLNGEFTARTGKPFGNKFTNGVFDRIGFHGFDGELAAWTETASDLCRRTTSAVSSHEGEPFIVWWLFDYLPTQGATTMAYTARLRALADRVRHLQLDLIPHADRLRLMPWKLLANMQELEEYDAANLDAGYEGTIICDPDAPHKDGDSSATHGGKNRIKRFVEEEAVVLEILEGEANHNEQTRNPMGQAERATLQHNMVPNGMVGAMRCQDIKTCNTILVSAGTMPHKERLHYFQNPHLLVGQTIKYKHFPKGVKDKPRFPTFQCVRTDDV